MDHVLVHGTTHSAVGWDRLTVALTVRGHRAVAVDLPVDRPELRAVDYGRLAAAQVEGMVVDPVVVAHSGVDCWRRRSRASSGRDTWSG